MERRCNFASRKWYHHRREGIFLDSPSEVTFNTAFAPEVRLLFSLPFQKIPFCFCRGKFKVYFTHRPKKQEVWRTSGGHKRCLRVVRGQKVGVQGNKNPFWLLKFITGSCCNTENKCPKALVIAYLETRENELKQTTYRISKVVGLSLKTLNGTPFHMQLQNKSLTIQITWSPFLEYPVWRISKLQRNF